MKEATDPAQIPWGRQTPDGQVLLSMPWEIFVLGLAVLSIINMALGFLVVFFERNPDIEQVISFVDALLIIVFLIDFLRRLHLATDDRAYLLAGRGWLDLVSVVPFLRIARILRIVRVYGLVGRMGGPTSSREGVLQGSRLRRPLPGPPPGHRRPGVRQPGDPVGGGARSRGQHHDGRRRALVLHRHDVDGGLR